MNTPKCDCCRQELSDRTRGDLKGLCRQCCQGLGGGKYSARIVKTEAAALKQRAASR
jgi:hypothetical protein